MPRSYNREVASLSRTYKVAMDWEAAELSAHLLGNPFVPTVFVGSGGMRSIAEFAAELHMAVLGAPAIAATPLQVLPVTELHRARTVVFTASARHPDVKLTIEMARSRWDVPPLVVTHRELGDIDDEIVAKCEVVTVPRHRGDGFLATHSVIAMATALIRTYGLGDTLPDSLPKPAPENKLGRPRAVIVASGRTLPAAMDLETRLSETGLAAAQLTDLRNLGHGRHVSLDRYASETTVVVFTGAENAELTRRTLELIPESVRKLAIASDLEWPAATIELLHASVHVLVQRDPEDPDPASPGVARFGRRLYHLAADSHAASPTALGAIDRKAEAARLPRTPAVRRWLQERLDTWRTELSEQRFGALVLDYDGTCCSTEGRFELPRRDVRQALVRVLDNDVKLAFASGRGRSLHRDLREWVPETFWDDLIVGMYSGGMSVPLSAQPPGRREPEGDLAAAAKRLSTLEGDGWLRLARRRHQLTAEPGDAWPASAASLAQVIEAVLSRPPVLDVRVSSSAHSVDIVKSTTSKASIVAEVAAATGGPVLAIGDQGQQGGNDFELLASTRYSLSVDRCSADPERCWALIPGTAGPDALVAYLAALQFADGRALFEGGLE